MRRHAVICQQQTGGRNSNCCGRSTIQVPSEGAEMTMEVTGLEWRCDCSEMACCNWIRVAPVNDERARAELAFKVDLYLWALNFAFSFAAGFSFLCDLIVKGFEAELDFFVLLIESSAFMERCRESLGR